MLELATALQALLPQAGIGWADPLTTAPGALPDGATAQRRGEFAAGRYAAAMAMRALGLPDRPVAIAPDRAPVWPLGLSGSITHTRSLALAAVARSGLVGIDLEPERAVGTDLWDDVLLEEEQDAVAANPARATVIFCAKEATYKAQYPMSGQLFGFDRLKITLGQTTFQACFRSQTGPIPAGTIWTGQFVQTAGHVLAAMHHR